MSLGDLRLQEREIKFNFFELKHKSEFTDIVNKQNARNYKRITVFSS